MKKSVKSNFKCPDCGKSGTLPHTHCLGCFAPSSVVEVAPPYKRRYCYACKKKIVAMVRRGR